MATIRQSKEDRLLLLRHDVDPFNRWESCQHLALDAALALVDQQATTPVLTARPSLVLAIVLLLTFPRLFIIIIHNRT
jgi:hypothetical protein